MSNFGKDTTTDDVLSGKDLSGKTVFVTGGNSGLGQETGRAMASKGAAVVLIGRDAAKLDTALAAIKTDVPDADLETLVCDLGSLESIRQAGAEASERFEAIDLLINNAGVMACPKMATADGFEMQFGTNHLGHFVLTSRLMPLIEKTTNTPGSARIINLSSRGHHIAPVDLDDPNFEAREYDPWVSYGQSKTANVLFSLGLEQRYGKKGVHAYAVHPGGINTNLGRHLSEEQAQALMANITANEPDFSWKTEAQGAATSVWAATADELEGTGGVYCEDCHVAEVEADSPNSGVRPYALDARSADQLWVKSEAMTGEVFGKF